MKEFKNIRKLTKTPLSVTWFTVTGIRYSSFPLRRSEHWIVWCGHLDHGDVIILITWISSICQPCRGPPPPPPASPPPTRSPRSAQSPPCCPGSRSEYFSMTMIMIMKRTKEILNRKKVWNIQNLSQKLIFPAIFCSKRRFPAYFNVNADLGPDVRHVEVHHPGLVPGLSARPGPRDVDHGTVPDPGPGHAPCPASATPAASRAREAGAENNEIKINW